MLTFRSASLKSLRKENSSPNWKTRQKKSARCWTILTLWQKRVKSYKIQYPSVYNSKTFSRNIVREERPLLNLLLLKIRDWVHFGKCYAVWLNVWAEKLLGNGCKNFKNRKNLKNFIWKILHLHNCRHLWLNRSEIVQLSQGWSVKIRMPTQIPSWWIAKSEGIEKKRFPVKM